MALLKTMIYEKMTSSPSRLFQTVFPPDDTVNKALEQRKVPIAIHMLLIKVPPVEITNLNA
jgi:hypothetical protein